MGHIAESSVSLVINGWSPEATQSLRAQRDACCADSNNTVCWPMGRPDSGVPDDVGSPADTGTAVDTGTPVDTGTALDTGSSVDTGTALDTGSPVDSGTVPDAPGTADSSGLDAAAD